MTEKELERDIRELLEAIMFCLKTYGKTDTDQTIKWVCDRIIHFLEQQKERMKEND